MLYGAIVLIVLQQVINSGCQIIPSIPCPDIFRYNFDGREWTAIITVPTPETNIVVITVNFTVGELDVPENRKIILDDYDNAIDNIRHYRPFRYIVTLPIANKIPQVTSIVYNNEVLCVGPSLPPPNTYFWLTYTYKWSHSGISFPRRPNPNTRRPPLITNTPFPPQMPIFEPFEPPKTPPTPIFKPIERPERPEPPKTPKPPVFVPQQEQPSIPKPNPPEVDLNNILTFNPNSQNLETVPKPKKKFQNEPNCGRPGQVMPSQEITDEIVPFIYDGKPIKINGHPWLAALFDFSLTFFCGGNLISNKHVVTAAHCTVNQKQILVKLGVRDMGNMYEKTTILRYANKIMNHPEYRGAGSAHADISLLLLNENVEYTPAIKPICVWDTEDNNIDYYMGKTATVMGWGSKEDGDRSSVPLQTNITIASQEQCRSEDKLKDVISDMTFCAGRKGAGPCMGDSGGGLFIIRHGKWFMRGIISVSLGNRRLGLCDVNTYAVFVDTAKYVDWIVEEMK